MLLQLIEPVARTGIHQHVTDLDHNAAKQRGVHGHLQINWVASEESQGLTQSLALALVHCRGRLHPGHAPTASLCRLLNENVEGGDDVTGSSTSHCIRSQPVGVSQNLGAEQLSNHLLANVDREVAVTQSQTQWAVRLDGPGETEELVLDLFEFSDGVTFEHGGGVAGNPVARTEPAEDLLSGRLTCSQALESSSQPPERGNDLAGRHHGHGLMDETTDLSQRLPIEELGQDGTTLSHRDRAVVDDREQRTVPLDHIGQGAQLPAGLGQRSGLGKRLLDGGQVALEGRVHRAPPAAAPDVSVRTAAMASLIRS